jgi:hypothetical protein
MGAAESEDKREEHESDETGRTVHGYFLNILFG